MRFEVTDNSLKNLTRYNSQHQFSQCFIKIKRVLTYQEKGEI